ncbi:Hypothetical protein GLP15_5217 [Giardia lamblia P15]|uniref:Uncharacterized protein n=1 Tax=Giardia intestinalis (strain P15) TaxID=658858 RepID=E1EWE6_GIAIA|nr:Hypothetical protein GLP15_5217 [Giardia lamblia P15]
MRGLNGPDLLQSAQQRILRSLSPPAPHGRYLLSDTASTYMPRRPPTNEYTMATLFSPQKCYGVRDDIVVDPTACSRKRIAQYERRHSLTTTRAKESQDELMNYTLFRADNVRLIVNRMEGHTLMVPAIPKPTNRKSSTSVPLPSIGIPLGRADRIEHYRQTIAHLPSLHVPRHPQATATTPKLYEAYDSLENANLINLSLA